jgi:hypothetical protein
MFLKTLSQPIDGRADSVTSLFVRRSVHYAFFPSCGIERGAPVVPEPNEGTEDSRTGEQNDDIDMPDAAAISGSSARGDDLDASPNPDAGLTETSQEDGPSTHRGVIDDLVPTPGTASMGAMKKSLVRKRSASSSLPAGLPPPETSSALQLVHVDDDHDDSDWSRKRPRTIYDLDTVNGQGGERASGVELESSGENQMVVGSPSISATSGRSTREDARTESSSSTKVTIWTNFEGGEYKELEGVKCNTNEAVMVVLQGLEAQCKCFPSTNTGRGIGHDECYAFATSLGGANRVYVTKHEEL